MTTSQFPGAFAAVKDAEATTILLRQLVSEGIRLAPSFQTEFEQLACRAGIDIFPDVPRRQLNLQHLDELIRFCGSLEGQLALERMWCRIHEPDHFREEFCSVHDVEVLA